MPSAILGLKDSGPPDRARESRRTRASVLVLYALLSIATIALVANATLGERAERLYDARVDSLNLARALERQVAGLLGIASQYLISTRDVIENRGGIDAVPPRRLERVVGAQLIPEEAIRRVLIVDAAGATRVLSNSNTTHNLSDRPWFRSARDDPSRAVTVGLPARSFINGDWVIPIAARIDNPDGSFGGVIAIALDVRHLVGYFKTLNPDPEISIALVRDDGAFLMREPNFESVVGARVAESNAPYFQAIEGTRETNWVSESSGRISSFRKVANYPLRAAVGVPTTKVLASWEQATLWRVLVAAIALFVMTVFTVMLLRRIRREQAAMTGLQHFRRAVDTCGDLVFWVSRTGRFAYANDAACARLGIDREALSRHAVPDISSEWDGPRWEEFWKLLEEKGKSRFVTRVDTPGGVRFPIGIAASRVVIEDEPYVFAIGRDLTDEVRTQAAIEAMNATLEQRVQERTGELARANGELKAFGYSVSHDLRAPLRHVSGYLEILEEDLGPSISQATTQLMQQVFERVTFMNALIDGLLKLSQVTQQPLAVQEVDLSRIAAKTAQELSHSDAGGRAEISIDEGLHALGDPALMNTLLQNLLGNAWKYSRNVPAPRITFSRADVEGEAAYVVRDNGAGFDGRNVGRLFGAFQRLHSREEFEGIGIGLATCKRIVERHGGRIWAEGRPGEGAAFFFTLAPGALSAQSAKQPPA